MRDRRRLRAARAILLVALSRPLPGFADDALTKWDPPPTAGPGQTEAAAAVLANPLDRPITGAHDLGAIIGGERPPSLEALQAARPGDRPGDGLDTGRAEVLRDSGHTYGAQGGLAARSFALNEMLRRHEAELDGAYDFRSLVLPAGSGQTLMKPPVVSAAQMAFALGDGGQVARETSCIYQITRSAELTSAPPNGRSYLVRGWGPPPRPADAALPRSKAEVAYWNKFVAEGWAQGEKQAVEIFLDDLGRLQRDIVGMARYRVLLRARLVEQPSVAFQNRTVQGGGDQMRVGDRIVRITGQPGLQANARRWTPGAGCPR
jgi:defect-in-organelle-trafficking protein DotC